MGLLIAGLLQHLHGKCAPSARRRQESRFQGLGVRGAAGFGAQLPPCIPAQPRDAELTALAAPGASGSSAPRESGDAPGAGRAEGQGGGRWRGFGSGRDGESGGEPWAGGCGEREEREERSG